MKKINKISTIFIVLISLASCSNDEVLNQEVTQSKDEQFTQRISEQLSNVKEVNNRLEEELNKDFFGKDYNLTLNDLDTKKSQNVVISESELLNTVKNYHQKKLTKTYKLRSELGFTSIQSIADEINSLAVINKNFAEKLFNDNLKHLNKSKFGVTAKIDSDMALITDKDHNIINIGKLDDSYLKNSTNSEHLKEGILVTDGLYAITWHANYREKGGIHLDFKKYKHETRIGSYFKINGVYIQYGSIISLSNNSTYHFNKDPFFNSISNANLVSFNSGTWVTNTYNVSAKSIPYDILVNGYIKGDFATIAYGNVRLLSVDTLLP